MLIEVHTREKPAIPRRAVISSILLLALATALAGTLTWRRSAPSVHTRIRPHGWSVSFRPPPGSYGPQIRPTGSGSQAVFGVLTPAGNEAYIFVRRIDPAPSNDPREVCDLLLREIAEIGPHVRRPLPMVWIDKQIGHHDAVEVWEPVLGAAVRAAVFDDEEVYALTVRVAAGPIDPDTYALFERTCTSMEYAD